MSISSEFLNYSSEYLNASLGVISDGLISKALSRKKLDDSSKISDIEEFIDEVEFSIGVICGKKNAIGTCKPLRSKAMELNLINEAAELGNSFSREAKDIDINEFLASIHAPDIGRDIIRSDIIRSDTGPVGTTKKEMLSCPSLQADIDDFVEYIRLLKLKSTGDELREQIETERLYRKFQEPALAEKPPEIDAFINMVKAYSDKNDIIKALEEIKKNFL